MSKISHHVSPQTNLECHRTDSEYEKHLILKTFSFEFVNSYGVLLWLALFRNQVLAVDDSTTLENQLFGIVFVNLTISNLKRVYYPNAFLQMVKRAVGLSPKLIPLAQVSPAEAEFRLQVTLAPYTYTCTHTCMRIYAQAF
jgi:hypothetical protein